MTDRSALGFSRFGITEETSVSFTQENHWSKNGILKQPLPMNCNEAFLVYSEKEYGLPLASNSYAVKIAPSEFILFDLGPGALEHIRRNLSYVSYKEPTIKAVFLTHWHRDHFGGIDELPVDVPVYAPQEIINSLERQNRFTSACYLYNLDYQKPRKIITPLAEKSEGYRRYCNVESFLTPGHTPHCTSYLVTTRRNTFLLVGDLVWGGFQKVIESDDGIWQCSLNKTLEVAKQASITAFGPGHFIPGNRDTFLGIEDLKKAKDKFTSGLTEKLGLKEANNPWKDIYPFYNRWST